MARKNKAAAPPLPKAQIEEPQKPKVTAKLDSSSEEEEEQEEEEGVEEESEEEEEESEDDGEEEEESESETDEEEEEESESESEEEEESKRETLRKLLEPFGKDQILDFLKEAALKDPSIIARITQSADCDPVHRKIFIHGLGWDATSDQVLSVFKPYGEIEECKVVTDKVTGRAKGYGFVLFKTRNGAKKALKQPQKKVGNRMSSCQLAAAGPPSATANNHQSVPDTTGRKIFVANVSPHLNPDKLRAFFAKFGEIEEGPLGHDHVTGKLKGFALFVYKTAEGCRKALEEPVKVFDGCQLQCRLANKNQTGVLGASGAGGAIHQSDIRTMNYSVGMNPGMLGNNMNPAAVLMGQNPMLASAFGQSAMPPSAATGFSSSNGANPSFGFGGSYGINSISPSMIGSYGSPAALQGPQGLSAYQSAQLGKSSAGTTSVAATRPQSGIGSVGTAFPSYYGR